MQVSDQQATVKRKWSADKTAGPLVLLAEWIQKRMIQHGWPCAYEVLSSKIQGPEEMAPVETLIHGVFFVEAKGRPKFTEEFWEAFDCVMRIVTHEKRVRAYRDGAHIYLDGQWHVNKYGVIRPGGLSAPF